MPTLTIQRDIGYADRLRSYRVLVDGREVGRLAPGGQLRTDLDAGRHTVEARIDWCGSRPLQFTAAADHVVVVRSALRGWRVFLALLYVVFLRRDYLTLELDPASGGEEPQQQAAGRRRSDT